MDHKRVITTLGQIPKIYRKILDPMSQVAIQLAEAQVERTKKHYDDMKRQGAKTVDPWGYEISHELPLRFKPSTILRFPLQVDIYCDVKWAEDDIPETQDIKVRIWSTHKDLIFKPERDAEEIRSPVCQNG